MHVQQSIERALAVGGGGGGIREHAARSIQRAGTAKGERERLRQSAHAAIGGREFFLDAIPAGRQRDGALALERGGDAREHGELARSVVGLLQFIGESTHGLGRADRRDPACGEFRRVRQL